MLSRDRAATFNLAIFRLVLLWFVALPFARTNLDWATRVLPRLPRDGWEPISFYRLIPLEVLSDPTLVRWLALANVTLIALAILGVLTRATLGVATLLSLYLFGLGQCFGKVDHFHHVIWFMALLAAGPSGHVLSVDACVRALRGAAKGRLDSPPPPGAARATLVCIWILFGLIFFATGATKLASALTEEWASADHVRQMVRSVWFRRMLDDPGRAPLLSIEAFPSWLLELGAAGVIAFQLGFLPLVLWRWTRPLLAVAGVAFHKVTGAVLGIWFVTLVPAYVVLVDWVALLGWVARRLGMEPVRVAIDRRNRWSLRIIALARTVDALDLLVLDPAPAPPPRTPRGVIALGVLLIAGQATVSAAVALAPGAGVPTWPFDRYPTFTFPLRREIPVWTAEARLADGRVVPLERWNAVCVRRWQCHPLRDAALAAPGSEPSRALARLLWRAEPEVIRAATREVVATEVRYRLDATTRVVDRRELHVFAPGDLR